MALPLSVLPSGIAAAGAPAAAKVTTNARVQTAAGPIGTVADVMQFPIPAVGNWIMGCTRVKIMGTPAVGAAAVGTAIPPSPAPPVPMMVTQGDPRVSGM